MALDDLKQHPFVVRVFDDAMHVHGEAGIGPLDDESNAPLLDEEQFYVTRVGYGLAHTLTWVEQLHQAVHFLAAFSYDGKIKQGGVNRFHHLIYSIENYLVRLQSVYDRLFQLTNLVFHICMSDELVNHGLIVSNLRVSRTSVPKLLKAVRKTIEPLKSARNDIVHKHSYTDKDLRRLELFYMHNEATRGLNPKVPFKHLKHHRSQLMKKATMSKRTEFADINASLLVALDPLFTELLAQYIHQRARLKGPAEA